MLKSVEYCHNHDIVHRDVKLENFLIDMNEDKQIIVKLSDFGLAFKYDPEQPPSRKCGSILSIAPEVFSKQSYCHKIDIWGLGVILHELLTSQLPFFAEDDLQYRQNIVNQELNMEDPLVWHNVSTEAADLI